MEDPLTRTYALCRLDLRRTLSRCFPRLCLSEVDDALQSAWLNLHQGSWEDRNLAGLLHRAAWFRLARNARCARRTVSELPEVEGHAPSPALVFELARLDHHVDAVLAEHPACYRTPLARALHEKLGSGEPDTDLARRHRLHRERINRAWNELRRRVAA